MNYLLGDLSARLGVAGSFPIFFGIAAMGLVYHLSVKDSFSVYWKQEESSLNEATTSLNPDSYQSASPRKFHWAAFWGILIRGLNHMVLITLTFLAFKYAAMAHVN